MLGTREKITVESLNRTKNLWVMGWPGEPLDHQADKSIVVSKGPLIKNSKVDKITRAWLNPNKTNQVIQT